MIPIAMLRLSIADEKSPVNKRGALEDREVLQQTYLKRHLQ